MKKSFQIGLFIFFLILIVSLVSSDVFVQNKNISLTQSIRLDGSPNDDILANITISDPDKIILVGFQEMTYNSENKEHNYTLLYPNTTKLGKYTYCISATADGENDTDCFNFQVTPNGELPDTGKSIFYIGALMLLIVFIILSAFWLVNAELIWIKFAAGYLIYIFLTAMTYIAWVTSINFFPSNVFIGKFFFIMFNVLLISLLPVIIVSGLYGLYLMSQVKQIKNLIDKGMTEEEATERIQRRKR